MTHCEAVRRKKQDIQEKTFQRESRKNNGNGRKNRLKTGRQLEYEKRDAPQGTRGVYNTEHKKYKSMESIQKPDK